MIIGPTEAAISCFLRETTLQYPSGSYLGQPFGTNICFIAKSNQSLPDLAVGELIIGGKQLFDGYLNDQGKTQESLINYQNSRFYRTGDYARRLPNGDFEILGRMDSQVKYHGVRIELHEIDHFVECSTSVTQAATLTTIINGIEHLVCFIVLKVFDLT